MASDGTKYYRTNFWQASADPLDADSFLISHRGAMTSTGSPNGNSIVRVTITGDARATPRLRTEELLKFKRVFGFKGVPQSPEQAYYGNFALGEMNGRQVLVVNNFRDRVNFEKPTYSVMTDEAWQQAETTRSYSNAFVATQFLQPISCFKHISAR